MWHGALADVDNSAVSGNEDHVKWDECVLHPEGNRLRSAIDEKHASFGGHIEPVH